MKQFFFVVFNGILAIVPCSAERIVVSDSTLQRRLQEVQVTATRVSEKTPMAFTSLKKEEITANNIGKDIPSLLEATPSVLTSSDAGMGIGYSSLRIRGTDATRINVTLGGVPLNDAESNAMYWVNLPDIASSLEGIQIQRGLGTSTNGSGAFGASVNMQTDNIRQDACLRTDFSAGSYGTHKENLQFGTGLLRGHGGLSGRLSNIGSDGYIQRASTHLNSYFLQGGYFGENTVVKFITFNGTERTYHAWDYATREDIATYGRQYNPCGRYIDNTGNVTFYDNQTDNYHQQHYMLSWNQSIAHNLSSSVTLHYTHGKGYYEQYLCDQNLYYYTLADNMEAVSDLIHRKLMNNDFYGTVFHLQYRKDNRLDATLGGGWNCYDGRHYGRVIWLRNSYNTADPDHEYYRNTGRKHDFNLYGKVNYHLLPNLNAYADLQYRYVGYTIHGPSEFYDGAGKIIFGLNTHFNFLNPKAGIVWNITPRHQLYASISQGHKEPTRNDYEDNLKFKPEAERLTDYEVGYKLKGQNFSAGANFYFMNYKNQLVLTGEQNAIGEMTARNLKRSYRLGAEFFAKWQPLKGLTWEANATLSRNRARNVRFLLDDTGQYATVKSVPLTFSPDFLMNNILQYKYGELCLKLHSQFVGEQFMTTTGLRSYSDHGRPVSLMLDAYSVSHLDIAYSFNNIIGVKRLTLGVAVYNIFSEKYESFGAASTALRSDGKGGIAGYQTDNYSSYSVYSVQAPLHFLAHLSLEF